MPKRKAPKKVNKEILKAIQFLSRRNPNKSVKIANIVKRVQFQVGETYFNKNMEKDMIREAVYKLRDLGLIEHVGHNQYCCSDVVVIEKATQSQPKHKRAESKYFIPDVRRTSLEKTTCLDPNRKKRHPENESPSSISGNEFERTRKRFHGKKQMKKDGHNAPLPGARQVRLGENEINPVEKRDHAINNEVEIAGTPRCNWDERRSYVSETSRIYYYIMQLPKSDVNIFRAADFIATEGQSADNINIDCDDQVNSVVEERAMKVESNEESLSAGISYTEDHLNDMEDVNVEEEAKQN